MPRLSAYASLTALPTWARGALLGYGLFGVLWIWLSDRALYSLSLPADQLHDYSELKGIAFVALSAAWAFAIAWRCLREQHTTLTRLHTESLNANNDRLMQAFFDLPFVGIAFTCPESRRWLRFNNRLCGILGYSRAELSRLTWSEITHPEDLNADLTEFHRMLAGEIEHYAMEKRFVRKDGSTVHASIDVHCLRREDRSIELFIATVDDISDEVAARQALSESEAQLLRVVRESPHPTAVLVEDGHFQLLSHSWCERSGYPCEQLNSLDDWLQRAHPPHKRDAIRQGILGLFDLKSPVDEGEIEICCAHGRRRYWSFRTVPLGLGVDGKRRILTTAVDVSEQRMTERVLKESVKLYRQMFDDNPICMYVFDADDLRLLAVNDAMVDGYGWSRDELLAMRLDDLRPKHEHARLAEEVKRLDPKGINLVGIWRHQRRSGEEFSVEVRVHALRFDNRNAWLAMAVDVSERERAREERDDYVRRLEQATDSTFQVISSMVELRDPYTAGHEHRVGEIAVQIAQELGLSEHVQQGLRLSGAVHDVGKIAIPAEILCKPTRLTPTEYRLVQEHTENGYAILKSIDLPWPIAEVARQHHERLDGSGYPQGLSGDAIVLEARIIAVADVVESMASHRPYRPALGLAAALDEIERGRDSRFDARVVDACLQLYRQRGLPLPK